MNKLLLDQVPEPYQEDADNVAHQKASQEYKAKIEMFIEMEKLKLVARAVQQGAIEKEVCALLD